MQRFFRANILREVIFMPYKFIRHILLLYPAAGIIVRIFIARAVPQRTCTEVMRVAQMLWHRALHRTRFFTRTENCRAAGVAFWGIGYIAHGLRQRQLCFRQAYKMGSLRRGISALPTSSAAQITMRRAIKRTSSPLSSISAR